MDVIKAKILDPTHLELSRPTSARQGEYIQVFIPEAGEENHSWQEAAKQHYLNAYDEQDAIYDEL